MHFYFNPILKRHEGPSLFPSRLSTKECIYSATRVSSSSSSPKSLKAIREQTRFHFSIAIKERRTEKEPRNAYPMLAQSGQEGVSSTRIELQNGKSIAQRTALAHHRLHPPSQSRRGGRWLRNLPGRPEGRIRLRQRRLSGWAVPAWAGSL